MLAGVKSAYNYHYINISSFYLLKENDSPILFKVCTIKYEVNLYQLKLQPNDIGRKVCNPELIQI